MAPIPNPGDLSRADRIKFYGHKYDHLPEPKHPATVTTAAPGHQLVTRRRADGTLEVAMRPIANPEDMSAAERRRVYGYRYAPRAETRQAPRHRVQAAPAPAVAARPAPAPVSKAAPAAKPAKAPATPVAKPAAPAPVAAKAAPAVAVAAAPIAVPPIAKPAPKLTPGEQLSAAVRPEAMKGSTLTMPDSLSKGQEGKVSLSLPANLLDIVKREAAKLGLGKAAKKTEVSATLSGKGYEITPNVQQTQTLKPGEAARFDWTVKPGAGDKAPLKATVDGTLTGDRKAKTGFSLGAIEQAVAAPIADAKTAAKGFKLPALSLKALAIPGMPTIDVPAVGRVASEKVVGGAIALLALLLVIGMARSASANRSRAERRRKFRTMQDYGQPEPELQPTANHEAQATHQSYVNPMVAAAAAGGGVVAAQAAHEPFDPHAYQPAAAAAEPVVEPAHYEPIPVADHGHHVEVPHEAPAHGHDSPAHENAAAAHAEVEVPHQPDAPHDHAPQAEHVADHGHDAHGGGAQAADQPHRQPEHA